MKPSGKRPSLPFLDRRRSEPHCGFDPREPCQAGQVSHERHVAPPADGLVRWWPPRRGAIVQRGIMNRVGSARGPLEQCRPKRQHPLSRGTGRLREDNHRFARRDRRTEHLGRTEGVTWRPPVHEDRPRRPRQVADPRPPAHLLLRDKAAWRRSPEHRNIQIPEVVRYQQERATRDVSLNPHPDPEQAADAARPEPEDSPPPPGAHAGERRRQKQPGERGSVAGQTPRGEGEEPWERRTLSGRRNGTGADRVPPRRARRGSRWFRIGGRSPGH